MNNTTTTLSVVVTTTIKDSTSVLISAMALAILLLFAVIFALLIREKKSDKASLIEPFLKNSRKARKAIFPRVSWNVLLPGVFILSFFLKKIFFQ